jgi:hypothetical protein
MGGISSHRRRSLSSGSPADWARQSFALARLQAYGELPPADPRRLEVPLDARYEADARASVALQLQRAGLRLARLLNEALR